MVTKNTQAMINRKNIIDIPALQARLKEVRKKKYGRPPEYKIKKSFAPSNLGFIGQCPRHWYYAFNGAVYNDKFNERSAAALENGKKTHERLQEEYTEAFYGTKIEVKAFSENPSIFGFIDVIFELEIDGERIVVDIKSIKDENFKALETALKPKDADVLQVLIYMFIKGYDTGLLHYENKNSHEELFFPIQMTDAKKEYVQRVLSWMRMVQENAEFGELPERPFKMDSWHCKFCPLRQRCWKDDKNKPGSIRIEPLEVEAL